MPTKKEIEEQKRREEEKRKAHIKYLRQRIEWFEQRVITCCTPEYIAWAKEYSETHGFEFTNPCISAEHELRQHQEQLAALLGPPTPFSFDVTPDEPTPFSFDAPKDPFSF